MIDYFALTFGHALLLLALWRLFLSPDLVADPARQAIKDAQMAEREANSAAGRAKARREAQGETASRQDQSAAK